METSGNQIKKNPDLFKLFDRFLYCIGFTIAIIGAFRNYLFMLVGLCVMVLSLVFYRFSINRKKSEEDNKNFIIAVIKKPGELSFKTVDLKEKPVRKKLFFGQSFFKKKEKVKTKEKPKLPIKKQASKRIKFWRRLFKKKEEIEPKEKAKPEEKPKLKKPWFIDKLKDEVYFLLFFISLVIIVITLIYRNPVTFILSTILMFLSLLGYRLKKKKAEAAKIEKKETKEEWFVEIKKEEYETDFDVLYKLVQKKKSLKLSDIERYFKIDKKLAEDWCSILESHGLLIVHYPPFGEPELKQKNETGSKGEV